MPEILTKYPEVVLQILNDAGAKCGKGATPQILKNCSAENFCALPTGELCIYNLNNVSSMTQLSAFDLQESYSHIPTMLSFINITLMAIIFLIGYWLGNKRKTFK